MKEELGNFLQRLRTRQGISRAELARRSGVALRTLSYWEACERFPRIPELEAALQALSATPAERMEALSLLPLPRSLRSVRTEIKQSEAVPGEFWAGTGDLMRAMRLRSGLTQTQAAQELGLNRWAISRWENGDCIPSDDNLQRLCVLLHAQPEEARALRAGYLHTIPARGFPSLEECEAAIDQLRCHVHRGNSPLIDLEALFLKRHLRLHCERSKMAFPLLAQVEYEHSLWLNWQDRDSEARLCISRMLKALPEHPELTREWLEILNLASFHVIKDAGYATGSLRFLRYWEARLPEGSLLFHRYCDAAYYAAKARDMSLAKAMLAKSAALRDCDHSRRAESRKYFEITRALRWWGFARKRR